MSQLLPLTGQQRPDTKENRGSCSSNQEQRPEAHPDNQLPTPSETIGQDQQAAIEKAFAKLSKQPGEMVRHVVRIPRQDEVHPPGELTRSQPGEITRRGCIDPHRHKYAQPPGRVPLLLQKPQQNQHQAQCQ